jgi:hypothetical protein
MANLMNLRNGNHTILIVEITFRCWLLSTNLFFDLYFKGGFMKDLNWLYMLDVLKGDKFTNIGLQQMAELNIGEVTGSKQYLKLTERLYTPTIMEKFAMK